MPRAHIVTPATRRRAAEIRGLQAAGLTMPAIAARLGINTRNAFRTLERDRAATIDQAEHATVDPYRCPGCGYRVTLAPCLICESLAMSLTSPGRRGMIRPDRGADAPPHPDPQEPRP
jgi:hypothetical protein